MGVLRKNLVGHRFNRWIVVGRDLARMERKVRYICQCDCGTIRSVSATNLRQGTTRSCGCYNLEIAKSASITHGHSSKSEYHIWHGMKARCYNKSHDAYSCYGGRGIKICSRWINSFENFFTDMGIRPENTSIDRINNDGDYEPDNCRWATLKEQNNNKRSSILIEHEGEVKSLKQWVNKFGLNYETTRKRILKGKSFQQLIR